MMNSFDFSQIHIFDKHGYELPLNYSGGMRLQIPNAYGDDAEFYLLADGEGMPCGFHMVKPGGRFSGLADGDKIDCIVTTPDGKAHPEKCIVEVGGYNAFPEPYQYIKNIRIESVESWDDILDQLSFPSVTFTSNIQFEPVSTELVETESLYILLERDGYFVDPASVSECARWAERYDLIFFIDNRDQSDFRVFSLDDGGELIWSDRAILNIGEKTSVNIGFSGKNEGMYYQPLYICVIDKLNNNEIYPIGEIKMSAEAVGEDERYRTLFTNFGIPDPKEYNDVFNDKINLDAYEDNISLNKHSKKVFLSYHEIFPYAGSYKALINAIKLLEYDDLFFKEWYKDLGKTVADESKYTAFTVDFKSDGHSSTISNVSLEERLQLRKLNWLSMMYHLNEEIYTEAEDQYGFPAVVQNKSYYDPSVFVKLIALRKWLEKYIIGVHCRIIDIGGEGIYFERLRLNAFGSYQQVIEYDETNNLNPHVLTPVVTLRDSSAEVRLSLDAEDAGMTLEDIQHNRFCDFCDGYLDDEKVYHLADASTDDNNSLYIGQTLSLTDNDNVYEFKAAGEIDSMRFGGEMITENSPSILVDENKIYFSPEELLDHYKYTEFNQPPIIQLECAHIRTFSDNSFHDVISIEKDYETKSYTGFIINIYDNDEIVETVHTSDYLMLTPSDELTIDRSIFSVVSTPIYETTELAFSNYTSIVDSSIIYFGNNEYYLDILDGKAMFNDAVNNRKVVINFTEDVSTAERRMTLDAEYYSDRFLLYEYNSDASGADSFERFYPGYTYDGFADLYDIDTDAAIAYNPDASIIINSAGRFEVDVTCYNEHNSIFVAKADHDVIVRVQDSSMYMLSEVESGNICDSSIGEMYSIDNSCIFEPTARRFISAVTDASVMMADTYTHYYGADNVDGVAQLNNLGYKFKYVYDRDGIYYLSRVRPYDGMVALDASDNILSERYGIDSTSEIEIFTALENLVEEGEIEDTLADVTVILYDESAEEARCQLPARLLPYPLPISAETRRIEPTIEPILNATGDIHIEPIEPVEPVTPIRPLEPEILLYGQDHSLKLDTDIVTENDIEFFNDNINRTNISLYVMPTWIEQIVVEEIRENESEETVMICRYVNDSHFSRLLKAGDLMRFTFRNKTQVDNLGEDAEPFSFGSCVMRVAENDDPNKIILIGKIDTHYIGEDYPKVYIKENINTEGEFYVDAGLLYRKATQNPEYVSDSSTQVSAIADGERIYAAAYCQDADDPESLSDVRVEGDEYGGEFRSYTFISYANYAYTNYTMCGAHDRTDASALENIIDFEHTYENDDTVRYVDTTFAATIREFDVTNAKYIWMGPDDAQTMGDASIYVHESGIVTYGGNVVACATYTEDSSRWTNRWKLYRRLGNSRTLILDVYNRNLMLNILDPGIYDIEAIAYDEYGNRHDRLFRGAITIKSEDD